MPRAARSLISLIRFGFLRVRVRFFPNFPAFQLLLNSMHKYRTRVHVLCTRPEQQPDLPKRFRNMADLDRLASLDYKTFEFPVGSEKYPKFLTLGHRIFSNV